jgi:hypothetical protein
MSTTTINKSVILAPGESFTLPPGSTIIAVSGDLTSTCESLPEPETLSCYYIQWEIEGDDEGSDAWENGTIDTLIVGGTTYTVNLDAFISNEGIAPALVSIFASVGLFSGISTGVEVVGAMNKFGICFKTIPSIAADMYLQITSADHTQGRFYPRLVSEGTEVPCACS